MTIQRIIQEAINENPLDLKEALTEELRSRIRLALEAKMSDEDDDSSEEDDDEEDMKEEAEQIDEISKDTLKSYINKAVDNKGVNDRYAGRTGDRDSMAISKKRGTGISKAVDKLTKEEVEQIDELKKSTLASYTRKAADSMANAAHGLGQKRSDADEVDRMTNRNMPNKYAVRDQMKKALGADDASQRKDRDVIGKRMTGIAQATNRLSKD